MVDPLAPVLTWNPLLCAVVPESTILRTVLRAP